MDFLFGLLTDSLITVVTFLGGLIFALLKKHYNQTKLRNILRFENTDPLELCCFTANTGVHDENERVTLRYVFEYMAAGELRSLFRDNYKKQTMKVNMSSSDGTADDVRDLYQNLILIGGPFHNSITARLVMNGKYKMPFHFDEDANLIYEGPAGYQEFHPELSANNRYYEHDYALILNIPNPLQPDKRILALMGCRSVGCYGAAYYISHHLKDMKKQIKSKDYAIVVEVIGDNEDIICEPKMKWHCPLELQKVDEMTLV